MRGALGCASAIVALGCTELSPLPVSSFPRDADVAFASDSVTFAFDRTSSTVWLPGLYIGRTDGSGINMLVLNAGDPTWSPDRKTIVFANFYTGILSRVDVASDSVQPFVTAGFSLAPSWSPDGSLVAFSSSQDNHNPPDLWIINATGGTPRRVPLPGPPRSEMDDPSWSPDGHYIVVSQGERLFRTDTLGVDTAWITPPGGIQHLPGLESERQLDRLHQGIGLGVRRSLAHPSRRNGGPQDRGHRGHPRLDARRLAHRVHACGEG